jgi:hypothetical protein
VFGLAIVGTACAGDRPDEVMMLPIRTLVQFMASPPASPISGVFASTGVVIVENFAPYIYIGPSAVTRWETGFRGHVASGDLSELDVKFGEPQDFSRDGDRAYFALPTTWTGRTGRQRFKETGVWSFVLVRFNDAWHVLAYAWGVMELQSPAKPVP